MGVILEEEEAQNYMEWLDDLANKLPGYDRMANLWRRASPHIWKAITAKEGEGPSYE